MANRREEEKSTFLHLDIIKLVLYQKPAFVLVSSL